MPPHFFEPQAGQLLFHYTSAEAALAILRTQTIWLSDFARMKDETEYHYARDRYVDAYQRREVWIEEVPRFMSTFALIGLEENTKMFIGCLSQEPDDPHQWKEYAADGSGCVIGVDATFLVRQAGVCVRTVVYDPNLLVSFVNIGLSMLQQRYEESPADRDELQELARFFVSDLFASSIRISRPNRKFAFPGF